MRLFIISLLAVSSVHSHAIGYPHRSELLAYSPARGEFPVHNSLSQGYIRYIDGNGAERLVDYTYPEPLYGMRRLSYGSDDITNPLLRTSIQPGYVAQQYYQQDSNDIAKAREDHFRAWCEQRFVALKAEVEKMRAEGKQPSAELMAQFRPLELILTASNYAVIRESPEVKSAREEHLRIWNEARLKVLQLESEHLKLQGMKPAAINTLSDASIGLRTDIEAIAPIEETAEQKKAREEHMRIYNEQLLRIQQLEAERLNYDADIKTDGITIKEAVRPIIQVDLQRNEQLGHVVMETPEVMRAKEEHLRLWNEAKVRAEKDGYKYIPESEQRPYNEPAKPAPISVTSVIPSPTQATQDSNANLKSDTALNLLISSVKVASAIDSGFKAQANEQLLPVQETPEVMRAREEHLKLLNEANLKVKADGNFNPNDDGSYKPSPEEGAYKPVAADFPVVLRTIPGIQQPVQPQQSFTQQLPDISLKSSFPSTGNIVQHLWPVKDTPEVIRAREEHLKIVNEAKFKTSQYQIEAGIQQPTQPLQSLSSGQPLNLQAQPLLEIGLKSSFPSTGTIVQQLGHIQDTPEVTRAREEHLKLVDEAKLKASQYQPEAQFLKSNNINSYTIIEDAEQLKEAERIQEEQRIMETELLRAAELLREEDKIREAERLHEAERLKAEERMMEAELLSIKQEDEYRIELERLTEAKRLKEEENQYEQLQLQELKQIAYGQPMINQVKTEFKANVPLAQSQATNGAIILSEQHKDNPFFLRFAAAPSGTAATTPAGTYIISEQKPALANYYLASSGNPFLLRYTQSGQPEFIKERFESASLTAASHQPLQVATVKTELKPISGDKISSFTDSSAGMKINYGEGSALFELEKATREHFRAHEIALEQLRLANLKNPYHKDCN